MSSDLFRLPIDRAFSVRGVGTVLTGTVWSGTVAVGDEVLVLPGALRGRVRSVESHGRSLQRSEPTCTHGGGSRRRRPIGDRSGRRGRRAARPVAGDDRVRRGAHGARRCSAPDRDSHPHSRAHRHGGNHGAGTPADADSTGRHRSGATRARAPDRRARGRPVCRAKLQPRLHDRRRTGTGPGSTSPRRLASRSRRRDARGTTPRARRTPSGGRAAGSPVGAARSSTR